MKRILILSHALELGGAERSLIGLLDAIDPRFCEVDLFLLRHEGELMGMIPEHVHLLPQIPAYTVLARPMKDTLKEGHFLLTAARLWGKLKATGYARRHDYKNSEVELEYSHKYLCSLMPAIQPEVEYDLAVSFLTPHYFVAEKVRAKKKAAWIHTDYTTIEIHVASELAMWQRYDCIAAISDASAQKFAQVFPSLREKLLVIENILPEPWIRKQAEESVELRQTGYAILSIGRYCKAKNFDNVPDICRRLVERGIDLTWYLIGFGKEEPFIRQKIAQSGMENRVIMLGRKENPYPYLKACDLYVQPSRYEGKCVSVCEAQMLGKPVVITDYATAASQLEDGVDGVIVPMDNQGCADSIAQILGDKEKRMGLSRNCCKRDYSNRREVEKLYELLQIEGNRAYD